MSGKSLIHRLKCIKYYKFLNHFGGRAGKPSANRYRKITGNVLKNAAEGCIISPNVRWHDICKEK